MSRKDWMGIAVFVLGAVLALFLGFMPDLVRDGHFTLKQASVMCVVVVLLSIVAFVVQQIDSKREERQRDIRETQRDELLQTILRKQMEALRRSKLEQTPQFRTLMAADKLYSAAINVTMKGNGTDDLLTEMAKAVLDEFGGIFGVSGVSGTKHASALELAGQLIKFVTTSDGSRRERANATRKAADSLAFSVFPVEERTDLP